MQKLKRMRAMSDKAAPDLKTFIENVNKKDKKRNGKKIQYAWLKRKRKTKG